MIRKKDTTRKLEIDISGPQGNAFYLLGAARDLARQLGMNADAISDEMKAGDYDHLVQTFDKHFGDYVDLVR